MLYPLHTSRNFIYNVEVILDYFIGICTLCDGESRGVEVVRILWYS